jgi:hypothetical protein
MFYIILSYPAPCPQMEVGEDQVSHPHKTGTPSKETNSTQLHIKREEL